ncbi:MAG: UbiD family decarboxylase [Saprospiraceae bacterium]
MSYKSLRECANDLEKTGQLIRIKEELDPDLEVAEVHRRVYENQGPALLLKKSKEAPSKQSLIFMEPLKGLSTSSGRLSKTSPR